MREPFRADPRRRAALEFFAMRDPSSPSQRSALGAQTTAFADRRFERLLEIIKRLAREKAEKKRKALEESGGGAR